MLLAYLDLIIPRSDILPDWH